jgi:hypothetical protein
VKTSVAMLCLGLVLLGWAAILAPARGQDRQKIRDSWGVERGYITDDPTRPGTRVIRDSTYGVARSTITPDSTYIGGHSYDIRDSHGVKRGSYRDK